MTICLTSNFLNGCVVKHGFFTKLPSDLEKASADNAHEQPPYNIERASYDKEVANFFSLEQSRLKYVKQVHSNKVVTVTSVSQETASLEADALASSCSGVLLAVRTADCIPVLFCDEQNHIIGAAHAGWRGLFSGILASTVTEMQKLGARDSKAVIGPSIRQNNYEVDAEFLANAVAIDQDSLSFFAPSQKHNHYLFNLQGYCCWLLKKLDVLVYDSNVDTYSNSQLFHSYRRSCHQAGSHRTKTQISCIMLAATS